jgi:GT2 family glycosyltransferase
MQVICHQPDGRRSLPLFGKTLVRGWATAQSGIRHVEVGILSGPCTAARIESRQLRLGTESPNVSANGFEFRAELDVSAVSNGPHVLYARARSGGGVWAQSEIAVTIDNSRAPHPRSLAESRELIGRMQYKPVISVITPVFNTPEKWLRLCMDSVLHQHYPDWELCLADDGSAEPHVRRVLDEYCRRDQRIKVIYCEQRGHIARASNAALNLASGEFIALLDADDELTADALTEIALTLNLNPSADMVYSDEDKIDENNVVSDPFYKPDWSPEYFQTCMYTCHLGVYRTSLVRELGGFRAEVTGAQDYDLALRLVSSTNNICHVPKVLYHWRTLPDSTASGGNAKDYAYPAAQAALRNYLALNKIPGEVLPGPRYGFHRIHFQIHGQPKVSVVIPTAGKTIRHENRSINLLRDCISSIRSKSTWGNLEVIAVDNGGLAPDLRQFLAEYQVTCLTYSEPSFNLAEKMNLGASHASGDHLVFLNDDTQVLSADWIENLLQYSQQPKVGAVGAKLLFPNGRIQHAGVLLLGGNPGHAYYNHPPDEVGYYLSAQLPRNYLAVTGACMMTRADLFRDIGGFDTAFPLNYNDVDYCLRLRERGFRIVYTPYAELYHYESVSKGDPGAVSGEELTRFHSRWAERFYLDPYYNPNLPVDYPYYRVHT